MTRATDPYSDVRYTEADTAKSLRVLHIITHLDIGGAENMAMTLIEALGDDVDFSVFAVLRRAVPNAIGHDMADRLARHGVTCRFGVGGRFKSGGVVVAAWALVRAVAEQRPDVIHVHTETPETTLAVACLMSRRVRTVPLVRTVHNATLWIGWTGLGRWVTQRLAHGVAVAVSRHAAQADAAIRTRTPRPPATIVYNGVVVPPPVPPDRAPGPVRLLFAGRLVHQKGADLLPAILAAAHARTTRRDVAVVIAGSGVLHDVVARDLEGRLPGWDVTLTDPIARLSDRFAEHDIVLVPSRFEGFGLLVVEALLAGLPVVTTTAPGLDEVVPRDYPFMADPGDVAALGGHLARMIDDPAGARRIAATYRPDLAARFGSDGMASAYLARYRALARCRACSL